MIREAGRREFLREAGLLIAAMHAGGWTPRVGAKAAKGEPSGAVTVAKRGATGTNAAAQGRPVEFLRLRLRTSRFAELKEFYSKVLELAVASPTADSLSVRAGATELLFVPPETGAPENPFYHFAFNIPENKLEASMAWMKGRAELIPSPATGRPVFDYPTWNAHSVYFYDPAGNILEYIARHNLKNAAAGGFDSRDILYASEIGMVVPEVGAAILQLKAKLGIADYVGVSDTFAPVGNEHGLFIVAYNGRKWFGRVPPGIFPAEVRMRGGTTGKYSIPEGSFQIEVIE